MTKRKNMTAGERQRALETKVEQHEATLKVMQMIIQQFGQNMNNIGKDIGELAIKQRDTQYYAFALSDLLSLKTADVSEKAEKLQIADFETASNKEDAEKGYLPGDVVNEDSVVTITTKAAGDKLRSILRSKLLVSEIVLPEFRSSILGKKVGDSFEADLNGTNHVVTVLDVKTVPVNNDKSEVSTVSSSSADSADSVEAAQQ